MLDFGFSEILLTSAIALVVLGPERLPKVARQVGNWMGRARLMARQLSEQLEREVDAEELIRQQLKPPLKPDLPPKSDQPPLLAPASAPVFPAAPAAVARDETAGSAPNVGAPSGPVSGEPAPVPVPAPVPTPRPLPDGYATTAAAMHPPAESAPVPVDQPHST
jgi:sec-independent protein translocase protein TatB